MALKILSVVGARPNFMKIAAICEAIKGVNRVGAPEQIHHVLVHTGQHYDIRPVTLEYGTNVLVGSDPEKIIREFDRFSLSGQKSSRSPRYWDGNAAKRIIKVLIDDFFPERLLVTSR
jgi:UDP-N-acetylglucosamine 2-epimerase